MRETVSLKEVKDWCRSVGAVYFYHLGHNIKLKGIRALRNTHSLTQLFEDAKEAHKQLLENTIDSRFLES